MKKPKVYILAQTELNDASDFLHEINVENYSTDTDNDAEALIEIAGKTCYMSFNTDNNKNLTKVRSNNNQAYIKNILDVNHGSVLEHATVTFGICNVSRIFTHELVRHRTGTAFSQVSGRYVRDDLKYYIPNCFTDYEKEVFTNAMKDIEYNHSVLERQVFDRLYQEGKTDFHHKKEVTSALRRILPNGQNNTIIFTANHRAIRHIINMRIADGAEEEIKYVFKLIKELMIKNFPNIYQDMV